MKFFKLDEKYRNDPKVRASFNGLTRKNFWFDFEFWYQAGCWSDNYLPYCVAENGEIIANVSVNRMNLLWNGEKHNAIQLGTVMTDPRYRNRGLIRELMDEIFREYQNQTEFFYLFANDSVLNFYPKFGFQRVREHSCTVKLNSRMDAVQIRKLNLSQQDDMAVLKRLVNEHVPIATLSMVENPNLLLFYCLNFEKDNLYYWQEKDILAVVEDLENTPTVLDVFSPKEFELAEVLPVFTGGRSEVALGFSPADSCSLQMEYSPVGDNDSLFMKPAFGDFLKTRFPVLSHA